MLTEYSCVWCKVQIAGQESEAAKLLPGTGNLSLLLHVKSSLPCLPQDCTFRPVLSIQSHVCAALTSLQMQCRHAHSCSACQSNESLLEVCP